MGYIRAGGGSSKAVCYVRARADAEEIHYLAVGVAVTVETIE